MQIGHLQQIKDFNLDNSIVRVKLYEHYGDQIPMDELVISPQTMFDSDLLETIIIE